MPRFPSVVLLLALAPAAWGGTVTTDTATILALQPSEEPPPEPRPGPWVADRVVTIEPVEGGIRVLARWRLDTVEPGWLSGTLAGPGVRVESAAIDGVAAPVVATPSGTTLTTKVYRGAELVVDAFVPGDPARGEVVFSLLAAARGRVDVRGTPLRAVVAGAVQARGSWWTGAPEIRLSLREPPTITERPTLAVARVATGVTIGDAELHGHARIEWQVRQGSLSAVSFGVEGVGPDLVVTGEDVASWRRDGDRVTVVLKAAERRQVALDATWSAAVPGGEEARMALPKLLPGEAFRTESVLEIARDGEVEVIPEISGAEPVAIAALPLWAEGIVAGTPTAAFRVVGTPSGHLGLLRFVPVEQPAVVVDVASFTVATSQEGRALARAHFTVRNERASHLRVVPPEGMRLLGVQVQGEPVVPGADGRPGWLVPLPRSLETVDGLLSFPIEVIAIGDGPAWDQREERTIGMLSVDAPVAVSRLTLYLPPGYEGKLEVGEDRVVADFTEGETISYGLAVGDAAVAVVDAKFQSAVESWMQNDFEGAQAALDELKGMGVETENVYKLQSNLDVVSGKSSGDEVAARRVKDQARARATEEEYRQQDILREAEEAERAGDYDRASSAYGEAAAIGDKLGKLEQKEAVEVDARNSSASSGYARAESKKKEKADSSGFGSGAGSATTKAPAKEKEDEDEQLAYDEVTIDFASEDIEGYLVVPQGGEVYALDGVEITGEIGGVEGGVVGGVVGGVLGGQVDSGSYAVTTPVEPVPEQPVPAADDWEDDDGKPGWLRDQEEPEPEEPPPDVTMSGSVTLDQEYVQNVPVGRTYESVVGVATTQRSVSVLPGVMSRRGDRDDGEGSGGRGRGKKGEAQKPAEKLPQVVVGGDYDAPLEVQAAALTVLVPALGETVRYQQLLLPSDARFEVVVRAVSKDPRRTR